MAAPGKLKKLKAATTFCVRFGDLGVTLERVASHVEEVFNLPLESASEEILVTPVAKVPTKNLELAMNNHAQFGESGNQLDFAVLHAGAED